MAYGIEIYDSLARKTLALESRLFRFHSVVTISSTPGTVYAYITGIAPDGTWGISLQFSDGGASSFRVASIESGRVKVYAPSHAGTSTAKIIVYRF
jgi:hypothetical protein